MAVWVSAPRCVSQRTGREYDRFQGRGAESLSSPVSPAMPADLNRMNWLPTEAPDNTADPTIENNRAATTPPAAHLPHGVPDWRSEKTVVAAKLSSHGFPAATTDFWPPSPTARFL